MKATESIQRGFTAAIVKTFITSKLSLLLLIASLLAGLAALLLTPREEEPQIVVPVADVFVHMPGASAQEVEKLVATPLEARLREVDGVEYVYSASQAGEAMVTVRFYVGEDREDSLVKVWNKLMSNQDTIPPGVSDWIVKPVEIDDVPIVTLALSSPNPVYDTAALRRLADELADKLGQVKDSGKITVTGGELRRALVYPDAARLAAHGVGLLDIMRVLEAANVNVQAGHFDHNNRVLRLDAGPVLRSVDELADLVVATPNGRPVYLREVAAVSDAPAEHDSYTRIGFGAAATASKLVVRPHPNPLPEGEGVRAGEERQAVTLAVSKRKGANAVAVAQDTIQTVQGMYGTLIPEDVTVSITRDYGETADHKVNELMKHLAIAIATIIVLLALTLGPKEALIVAIAVPMTLGVTLLFDLVCGYTINRVTLFALILSLGLLVDDPIVDVENIYRHFKLHKEPPLEATLTAVDEVRPPTIFATFTVIVSFLPLYFITGMMGPYMGPMAFNVPIAMLMSLLVAFTVTPWASYHLLKPPLPLGKPPRSGITKASGEGWGEGIKNAPPAGSCAPFGAGNALESLPAGEGETAAPFDLKTSWAYRFYSQALGGLIATPTRAKWFLWATLLAFVIAALLAVTRVVPLKLLPFDNKNELLLVIDLPRDSTLEQTDGVARALGGYLATVDEVTDYESYVGLASPMDFNGMVRHYYLRRGGAVGEIRINLLPKEQRKQQSHEIALRIRPDIERLARQHGAKVKIVETPAGPPVLSTFVAEVYGPLDRDYDELNAVTERVRGEVEKIDGVVDVDDRVDEPQTQLRYQLDRQKAALHGVSVQEVASTLRIALSGGIAGTLHVPGERRPLEIVVRLPRSERSAGADLLALRVKAADGALLPLSELGEMIEESVESTIYHKNLKRLNYVTAEMAGRSPVEAVFDYWDIEKTRSLPPGYSVDLAGEGEWKITVDVFRDLGLAFGAALLMIYVLLVAQTASLGLPLVIMVAIPLTVIGIMPGFWLLNLFSTPVAGYDNPILFTATGMIGMIALAGIVVRNSIILIDFIGKLREQYAGSPLLAHKGRFFRHNVIPPGRAKRGLGGIQAHGGERCDDIRARIGDGRGLQACPPWRWVPPIPGGTTAKNPSKKTTLVSPLPGGEGEPVIRDANSILIEALIEAGATRLRPIFLTAGAAMFGSIVITLDPIFSGLAWSFIFGIFASTAFSLLVVPVVYYLLHRRG